MARQEQENRQSIPASAGGGLFTATRNSLFWTIGAYMVGRSSLNRSNHLIYMAGYAVGASGAIYSLMGLKANPAIPECPAQNSM